MNCLCIDRLVWYDLLNKWIPKTKITKIFAASNVHESVIVLCVYVDANSGKFVHGNFQKIGSNRIPFDWNFSGDACVCVCNIIYVCTYVRDTISACVGTLMADAYEKYYITKSMYEKKKSRTAPIQCHIWEPISDCKCDR